MKFCVGLVFFFLDYIVDYLLDRWYWLKWVCFKIFLMVLLLFCFLFLLVICDRIIYGLSKGLIFFFGYFGFVLGKEFFFFRNWNLFFDVDVIYFIGKKFICKVFLIKKILN